MESGDIYEQAVVKTLAGFLRGKSTHLFGITRFGVPDNYVRTGSIHLNEAVGPQSPGAGNSGDALLISARTGYRVPHSRRSVSPIAPPTGLVTGGSWGQTPVRPGRWGHSQEDQEKRRFKVREW
jgi:hypothetical protein